MNKIITKHGLIQLLILVLILGSYTDTAFAAAGDPAPGGGGGIKDPLGGGGSVEGLLTGAINWLLGISALLALLAMVWGGTRMILDFGTEEGSKKGKTIIKWAIVGLVVIAGSFVILETIVSKWLGA